MSERGEPTTTIDGKRSSTASWCSTTSRSATAGAGSPRTAGYGSPTTPIPRAIRRGAGSRVIWRKDDEIPAALMATAASPRGGIQ